MDVEIKNEAGRCVISFNRIEKKNALIPEMYTTVATAIDAAAEDTSCHVIVLRGNGQDFTAGNDIGVFAKANQQSITNSVIFMRALMNCPLPVIAEVKGNAVGIGTTMLLHCDFVLAANNSRFMMPFINLGLVPEYASSYILPKVSGYLNAAKWLMLGNGFDAQEAYQANLVTKVCSLEDLDKEVEQFCVQLINKPRNALIETKALLKANLQEISTHIDMELEVFAKALQSDAAREAFDAFLNKRPIDKTIFLQRH